MKKLSVIVYFSLTMILLSACGTSESNQKTSSSTSDSTTATTSTTVEEQKNSSKYTAVLQEDAQENGDTDKTIRLTLAEVKATDDPEDIVKSMENDGVILNITADQLADDLTMQELRKGEKITFELNDRPVMTASIPPQIPGMSVIIVEKSE